MGDSVAPNFRGVAQSNMDNIPGSNMSNTPSIVWPQNQANVQSLLQYYKKQELQNAYGSSEFYQNQETDSSLHINALRGASSNSHVLPSIQIPSVQLPVAAHAYQSAIPPLVLPYMIGHYPSPLLAQQRAQLSEYERAIKESSGHKASEYRCQLCGKLFSDSPELQNHIIQVHANKPDSVHRPENAEHTNIETHQHVPKSLPSQYHPSFNPLMAYQSILNAQTMNGPNQHQLLQTAAMNPYLPYMGYPQVAYPQLSGRGTSSLVTPTTEVLKVAQSGMLNLPTGSNPQKQNMSREPESPRKQLQHRLTLNAYEKESLQKRLSAPLTMGSGEGGSHYVYPSQHLPRRLIAPNPESPNSSPSSSGHAKTPKVNHKLIEDHISKLISHNEQVLLNPTLEKVKPRRVYRRNSLDPASLPSHPNPPSQRMPLGERLSYGVQNHHRNLELPGPDMQQHSLQRLSPLSSAALSRKQWPQGLTQPTTMISNVHNPIDTKPEAIPSSQNSYYAKMDAANQHLRNIPHDTFLAVANKTKRPITPDTFSCQDCGVQFRNEQTFQAHRKLYCRQNVAPSTKPVVLKQPLNKRQSVIQHTDLLVDTDDTASNTSTSESPNLLLNPNPGPVHRDICRTRSADAALFYSNNNVTPLVHNTDSESTSPNISPVHKHPTNHIHISSIPTNKLPPKKKQLQLMRTENMQTDSKACTDSECKVSISPVTTPVSSVSQPVTSSLSSANDLNLKENSLSDYKSSDNENTIHSPIRSPHRGGSVSPTSPRSPQNPTFGGLRRRSKSPRRSPSLSPNNLENTVPRSNYKLLLHQISMRNMQDIGYLSEAFYTSKNPNLKRRIASILWSDTESTISSKTRRRSTGVTGTGTNLPVDTEVFRRKSHGVLPGELSRLPNYNRHNEMNAVKEIRSISPSTTQKMDFNNNNNKNFQDNAVDHSSKSLHKSVSLNSHKSKEHLPLRRRKANAPFIVQQLPTALINARSSPSPISSPDVEKHSSSTNPNINTSTNVTIKRSNTGEDKETSHPKKPKFNEHFDPKSKNKIAHSSIPSKLQSILFPHLKPVVGFDCHVSYCSLINPQPCYMKTEKTQVSMYSQWAVSDPILLPKDLTVKDILNEIRIQTSLSKYISYNSLFMNSDIEKTPKLVDSKNYDKQKFCSKENTKKEEVKEIKPVAQVRKNLPSNCIQTHTCYTSCHNKSKLLPLNKDISKPLKLLAIPNKASMSKHQEKSKSALENKPIKKKPKFVPPTVVIQPPSPEGDNVTIACSPPQSPSHYLEVSDSDSDDTLVEKKLSSESIVKLENTNAIKPQKIIAASPVSQKLKEKLREKLASVEMKQSSSSSDNEAITLSHGAKKRRRSRKERNADSPLLQKRKNGLMDAKALVQDSSLAVHPTGACSKGGKDPPCALCSMKAGPNIIGEPKKSSSAEVSPTEDDILESPPAEAAVPILTVSVPVRSKDKLSKKFNAKSLTPAKLDRARGSGSTQHWVSTTDLTPPNIEHENVIPTTPVTTEAEKSLPAKVTETYNEFKDDIMPPNKNPMSALQNMVHENNDTNAAATSKCNAQLQEVVSEVIRSAAMQSQQKTPISSKSRNSHPLSSSRPLILGTYSPAKSSMSNSNGTSEKSAILHPRVNNLSRLSQKQLTLSERESEMFLARANKPEEQKNSHDVEKHSSNPEDSAKNSILEKNDSLEEEANVKEDKECYAYDTEVDTGSSLAPNPRQFKCIECKTAFRIAGHLAKHLKSKSHIIAMQKKTLNRLKQQQHKLSGTHGTYMAGDTIVPSTANGLQLVQLKDGLMPSTSVNETHGGTESLARSQVRALFEGNDEYTEIIPQQATTSSIAIAQEMDIDERGQGSGHSSSDPRPFKCTACKVAFRFQGHLDRHFRSNHHLLAVGHFEIEKNNSMLSSSGEIMDSEYYLKKNGEGGAYRESGPISDEESWEFPNSPVKSSTEIEKCERELAETDKKIQQLQALSNSVDHSMSLLNHNVASENSLKQDNCIINERQVEKNCESVKEPQKPLESDNTNEMTSTFVNPNHYAGCYDSMNSKKVGSEGPCFNNNVMQDGHISPVPVKLQQLTC